jgi:formiminoglutamate deiminase
MYRLANTLDLDAIESIARLCFMECLEAGYTAIGEFHYLHHSPDGTPWAEPSASSRAICRAARQTGIRLTLLWTVYQRGGFGEALRHEQRRFRATSLDDVWRALDSLSQEPGERVRLGLAIHSVRAVSQDWLGPLAQGARDRGLPIHAHVSEQVLENEACLKATGLTPVGLLAKHGVLGADFTAIHATWLNEEDIALLRRSGATVGLCPSTEGDLGDGVPDTAALYAAGIPLAIGSDSHALIDPFSELRSLEYQARARTQTRCVLSDIEGEVAPVLAKIGHNNGFRCLGFEPSDDRVELDPDALALSQTPQPSQTALLAGNPGLIRSVHVGGESLVLDGRHVGR